MSEASTTTRTWSNVGEARAEYQRYHSAWWSAFCDRGPSQSQLVTDQAKAELQSCEAAVLAQFGKPNPAHPDCSSCVRSSVFGGPRHEPSKFCKSGKHPHCSCDTCF